MVWMTVADGTSPPFNMVRFNMVGTPLLPRPPAQKEQTLSWSYIATIQDNIWSIIVLICTAIPVIVMEKWDAVKGMYWMAITATTIGLGDETPLQPTSRALCIIYIPIAVYLTGRFVGLIASAYVERRVSAAEDRFLRRTMTLSDIERMDFNNDGRVSESEFLIYMLVTLQKVEQDDVDEILTLFHKLDKSGDGVLTKDDLEDSIRRTNEFASDFTTSAGTYERSWTGK
jgi:CBS domain-containing protein